MVKLLLHFPQRTVLLGICEHSNCTCMWDEKRGLRSPRKGGLGFLPIDPWSSLFASTQKPNQLTYNCGSHSNIVAGGDAPGCHPS